MAQRKKSEFEFIQDTFCPQVAALCSYDAEITCRKNALTFVELVQPFCRHNGEIKITDPSNNLNTITNLRVEIKDINVLPVAPHIGKKLLDDSVTNSLSSNYIDKQINLNHYDFIANVNTPWFESWRECFAKIGYPDDHEFLKHFIACIFVVSTSHIDPLDQFQKLILQMQQPNTSSRYPKWIFPHLGNIYKYFVLLHDAQDGELAKAHSIYENLKSTYGSSNCHLLQINSKNVANSAASSVSSTQTTTELDPWLQYCKFNDLINGINQLSLDENNVVNANLNEDENITSSNVSSELNDPLSKKLSNENLANVINSEIAVKKHGMCLALSDHDRIKTFVGEFLQRGLVPYAERTIKLLYDHIQSKKSILKSLSIPRRIFGGSSNSSSSSSTSKSTSLTPSVSVSASSLASNNSTNAALTITNNFVTPNDEFQQRRLADLAFMFRLYDLAYTSYHSCKKEYSNFLSSNSANASNSDQMLLTNFYLAGSLEMASVAHFMQNFSNDSSSSTSLVSLTGSSKTYNSQYIDEAIQIYLNICKNVYFATRATLLSTEALRLTNQFSKAAFQFVNLANDETDVRSALFLEQAALCYLAQPMPWIRKYAFFMSLAGHRFNKSGQKKHALRVYKHSLEIYNNRGWFKAQDHINFVTSRICFNLKDVEHALEHIQNIIVKKYKQIELNTQTQPHQHALSHHHHHHNKLRHQPYYEFSNEITIIKDFILYSSLLTRDNVANKLPLIPVPFINNSDIRVNLMPSAQSSLRLGQVLVNCDLAESESQKKDMWLKFEENLYKCAFKTPVPIIFKPQLQLLDIHTDNKQMPKVVVNESVEISFEMKNNFKTNLVLNDLTLLWKFVDQTTNASNPNESTSVEITNESGLVQLDIAECSIINELIIKPKDSRLVSLYIKPLRSHGHLHILGVKYTLNQLTPLTNDVNNSNAQLYQNSLSGKHLFEIRGARLNNTSQAMKSVVYEVDNRLNFKLISKTASMQIEMSKQPGSMLCDQVERFRLYFINKSDEMSIGNIKIASNAMKSSLVCFSQTDKQTNANVNLETVISFSKDQLKPNELIYSLENVEIKANEHYELDMWLRAPSVVGEHKFYFMFFYEDISSPYSASHSSNSMVTRKPSSSASSSHYLKYRVVRYEFSIKTTHSLDIPKRDIIYAQGQSDLLLNLEVANSNFQTSYELVNSISLSDNWLLKPIQYSSDLILRPQKEASKFGEFLSVNFRGKRVLDKTKINFFKSNFLSTDKTTRSKDSIGLNTLLYFIKMDLIQSTQNFTSGLSFLNLYLIWKSLNNSNEDSAKYGLTRLNVLTESETSVDKRTLSSLNKLNQSTLLVEMKYQENKQHDFKARKICSVDLELALTNTCEESESELILFAKNQYNHSKQELNKNYLWIGSNKRFVKLKAKQSKVVKFKLAIVANGVYEIGKIKDDTLIKLNLLEASKFGSNETKETLEDLNYNKIEEENENIRQIELATISIFKKKKDEHNYELFKRLNPFTIKINKNNL